MLMKMMQSVEVLLNIGLENSFIFALGVAVANLFVNILDILPGQV